MESKSILLSINSQEIVTRILYLYLALSFDAVGIG